MQRPLAICTISEEPDSAEQQRPAAGKPAPSSTVLTLYRPYWEADFGAGVTAETYQSYMGLMTSMDYYYSQMDYPHPSAEGGGCYDENQGPSPQERH